MAYGKKGLYFCPVVGQHAIRAERIHDMPPNIMTPGENTLAGVMFRGEHCVRFRTEHGTLSIRSIILIARMSVIGKSITVADRRPCLFNLTECTEPSEVLVVALYSMPACFSRGNCTVTPAALVRFPSIHAEKLNI